MTRFQQQDGSMPLTLLVVILVGGLVAALVSVVTGTQRSVNFDRQYAEAITAADVGLQQALTYLQIEGDTYTTGDVVTPATVAAATGTPMDLDVGAGATDWTAEKLGPAQWEVRAEGTVGEVTRVVESSIAAEPEFFLAAFGELGITMNGSNLADSYPLGGFGAIGSNNLMTLRGSTVVDLIYEYGAAADCTGAGCTTGTRNGSDDPLDMDGIRATVIEKHAACGGSFSSWRASSALVDGDGDGAYELAPGTLVCATDVVIDVDIEIPGADQADPAQFMVADGGEVSIDNGLEVNCQGCTAASDPVSGALRIYTLGDLISVGNHAYVAAGILAPNATCQGNPSAAQSDVFGSIVCSRLGRDTSGNQGGWNFHFDENLLRVGSGKLDIDSYREESTATTSFAP